jgi:leucyl aminopeptidase
VNINFVDSEAIDVLSNAAIAVIIFADKVMSEDARKLDEESSGLIGQALAAHRFEGKLGQSVVMFWPRSSSPGWLVLVGGGEQSQFNDLSIEEAAANAYKSIAVIGAKTLELRVSFLTPSQSARAGYGGKLAAYRFCKYRTQEPVAKRPSIEVFRIVTSTPNEARAAFATLGVLSEAIYFVRDLVSEPPNVLYPAEFASRVKAMETLGLEVEILGKVEMESLKMGALLGVGQGSARESKLVVIRWNGTTSALPPLAFVGKGVCFDSGGITLKPGKGMEAMKNDMAGAAAVAGLMRTLASRKAKVHAVGILALVENMPDGAAQRPSDVWASMSGQTIEIISTDAEGRLILADALWYCQSRFKPQFMIDIATLTGAIYTALGNEYAGIFSNDSDLAASLVSAASAEGEPLWQMPLPKRHEKLIESDIADVKNHADSSLGGGAIVGAQFIQRFINNCPWAHLDISGTAWRNPSNIATVPDGATAIGVRLLHRFVADNYEQRPTI